MFVEDATQMTVTGKSQFQSQLGKVCPAIFDQSFHSAAYTLLRAIAMQRHPGFLAEQAT